jgi:hypothetical protein
MRDELQIFIYTGAVLGWLMCFFHSYNWVKKDCGCDDDERPAILTNEFSNSNDDKEPIIDAIIIDEL